MHRESFGLTKQLNAGRFRNGSASRKETMVLQILGLIFAFIGGIGSFIGMKKKIDGDYIMYLYITFIIGILFLMSGTIIRVAN
jgi:TM2 domain-containing membrane protein YozV